MNFYFLFFLQCFCKRGPLGPSPRYATACISSAVAGSVRQGLHNRPRTVLPELRALYSNIHSYTGCGADVTVQQWFCFMEHLWVFLMHFCCWSRKSTWRFKETFKSIFIFLSCYITQQVLTFFSFRKVQLFFIDFDWIQWCGQNSRIT